MHLLRAQAAERLVHLGARQGREFIDAASDEQFGSYRPGSNGRRAAHRLESGFGDAGVDDAQGEVHDVAAGRVGDLRRPVRVFDDADVAGVVEVLVNRVRVLHAAFSSCAGGRVKAG